MSLSHRHRFRSLLIVFLSLLAIVIVCFAVYRIVVSRSLPSRDTIELSDLSALVQVHRDDSGVPYIVATSRDDAYLAQGYVHAQDRFFQMDFYRRMVQGRLAELLGEDAVEQDIFMRTLGLRSVAVEEYAALSDSSRSALQRYSAGVNAYLDDRELKPSRISLEYLVLGLSGIDVQLDPWTPEDSLAWLKAMSADLADGLHAQLERLDLIRAVGTTMAADYYVPYRYESMPTIIASLAPGGGADGPGGGAEGPLGGAGSNSWVISGKHTESGLPILANDPHLQVQIPSTWYENSLQYESPNGQEVHVRGFSLAGVPGVVIGHNAHVAWGITDAVVDEQDLYIERTRPDNPDEYLSGGEWLEMEKRNEVVFVRGREEGYGIAVRSTRNGPVITDYSDFASYAGFELDSPNGGEPAVTPMAISLRWTALDPGQTIDALLSLNQARNYTDFRESLRLWSAPLQNFVYADRVGNIAYQMAGRVPDRGAAAGRLPLPGWDDSYQWSGFVPYEDMPFLLNPDTGFIVAANNPAVRPVQSAVEERTYASGYRAKRITALIEGLIERGNLSVEDSATIQLDNRSLFHTEVLPFLRDIPESEFSGDAGERAREARDLLLRWNGEMAADSGEAALFAAFFQELVRATFADEFAEERWGQFYSGRSVDTSQNSLSLLLRDEDNSWWDDRRTTSHQESRDTILVRALSAAHLALLERLGPQRKWEWGRLHTVTFSNPAFPRDASRLAFRIFAREPRGGLDGGLNQVNRAAFTLGSGFDVSRATSARMLLDMAELDEGRFIQTTGQSGHVGSRFYDSFIADWASGRYHTLEWRKPAVENLPTWMSFRPRRR